MESGEYPPIDNDEDRWKRVELFVTSFRTIRHDHWPILQLLCIRGIDNMLLDAMKGLLRLSTLTKLSLNDCTFNKESLGLIQPGS
jgi:hypothetical protein